jgi:hypothetical protein
LNSLVNDTTLKSPEIPTSTELCIPFPCPIPGRVGAITRRLADARAFLGTDLTISSGSLVIRAVQRLLERFGKLCTARVSALRIVVDDRGGTIDFFRELGRSGISDADRKRAIWNGQFTWRAAM